MNIRYQDYLNSISAFLCESYGYTVSYAKNMVEEFDEFLHICFKDGWSALSCAELIDAEGQ